MVESCNLVLYDQAHHKGTSKYYSSNTDLRAKGEADRDHSAKLAGSCKNTSYLVFEHPWAHKGQDGGLGYLIGESDRPGNLHKTGQNDYEKGRYWKRSGRADHVVRINIPSENVNEGRMREDIKVFGKSNGNAGNTHLDLRRANNGNPNRSDQWLTGIYNNDSSIKKGQPCPGGDAYWKNAIDSEISCVYDVKTGSKLGRIRTLHSEITNSTIPNDPRKTMFDKIVDDYCDRADRLNDKVTSGSGDDSTCRGFSNAKEQMKGYCKQGDKIKTDTMLCTKETDSLGPTLYDELASKYCDANPNDPFCGCYNVVTNKCKGEDIDKEIKRLEDARKPIEGVSSIWYGFDNKTEYLNIGQIEVYSGGKNIVKDIPGVYVTVNSEYGDGTQYKKNQMFDGNYTSMYHSAGKPNDWIKIELGKDYNIDEVKVFNRHSCGAKGECNDRWAGSFVKLLDSSGNLIKASEKVVGDHKEGGVRVKTFFDNGVAAAKAKLTIPGCKITVPIRRTLNNLPPSIPQAALDGADKCWGNVCGPLNEIGGDNFVPENTIAAGGICSKSMTICNIDLSAGNLQDSEINIEQSCGEQEGEPSEPSDGSTDGTPAPMGSSSTPLKSSSSKNNDDEDDEDDEKELQIYEKPAFQIGTVASSSCSIFSCLILIMLTM